MKKIILITIIFCGLGAAIALIPKYQPFGNSTTFSDSTNYVTINKGWKVYDSLWVGKDAWIKGKVLLDSLGKLKIYAQALDMVLENIKSGNIKLLASATGGGIILSAPGSNGNIQFQADGQNGMIYFTIGEGATSISISKTSGGAGLPVMYFDSTGIHFQQTYMQYYTPSDTASDYDGNDVIDLDRPAGTLITKSLSNGSGTIYTVQLRSSLIKAKSVILVTLEAGTNTTDCQFIQIKNKSAGQVDIDVKNTTAATLMNGTVKLNFSILNNN